MAFKDWLRNVAGERDAYLRAERAKKVREEQAKDNEDARNAAIREELAQRFVYPILNDINDVLASGKGRIEKHNKVYALEVSLAWNESSSSYERNGESIHISIDLTMGQGGLGAIDVRGGGAVHVGGRDISLRSRDNNKVRKDDDIRKEIEGCVKDVLKKEEQKYHYFVES